MSVIVYNESVSTLKEEINNANASLLTQVREIADNQFTNMKRLSFQVQWNARVLDLFTPSRDLNRDKDYDYELYQITQAYKGFISMNHIGGDGINRKAVAYLHHFNSANKEQPSGMNVTIVDQAQILKSIENVQLFNKGKVLILNNKNEILISNDNSAVKLPVDFPYDRLTENSDSFLMKRGNQNYEVTVITH